MTAVAQEPLWLVWQYEGDFTLYDLMQKKEWPYNLEPLLFGRELNLPKSPRRRWITLRVIMQQVIAASMTSTCCSISTAHGHGEVFHPQTAPLIFKG